MLDIINGPDERDSTTIEDRLQPADVGRRLELKNLTIGIPKEYHSSAMSPEILDTWQYVTNVFRNAGATIKEVNSNFNSTLSCHCVHYTNF